MVKALSWRVYHKRPTKHISIGPGQQLAVNSSSSVSNDDNTVHNLYEILVMDMFNEDYDDGEDDDNGDDEHDHCLSILQG